MAPTLSASPAAPAAALEPHEAHGYPWHPLCSCGWRHLIRYASEAAALLVASEHAIPGLR